MYKRIITAALVFGLAAIAPPEAEAQMVCGAREKIHQALAETYDESRTGFGLQNRMSVVELWTSSETGSWTILLTRADGVSCIIASGLHWQGTSGGPAVPDGDPA